MITFSSRFKKRKTKGLFLIIFLGVLAIGGVSFLINSNLKINQERIRVQSKVELLEQELQKSQSEREEFLSKISKVQKEEYLETVARQDLNLRKPGEKVVAFPVIKEKEVGEKEKEEEKTFLQKLLEIFKIK